MDSSRRSGEAYYSGIQHEQSYEPYNATITSRRIIMDDQHATHTALLTTCAFDAATVRMLERPLLAQGVPLMRMAASAAAQTILNRITTEDWDEASLRICVLAGSGDNGGDGLYTGAMLAAQGFEVTAIAVGRNVHPQAFEAFIEAGGHIFALSPLNTIPGCPSGFSSGEAGQRLQQALTFITHAHIIIDAMTGIGNSGALHGIPAAIASAIGLQSEPPQRPGVPDQDDNVDFPYIVAIDTPSGIGIDNGTLPGAYLPADVTIMFGALKPCAVLPPAAYACGTIILVDFNFDFTQVQPLIHVANKQYAQSAIRTPLLEDAKYERGVTGLITGSTDYPGAAVLSTTAAAHSNIGMVRYLGPERAQQLVLQALPEAVIGKGHVQSWVVGSGVPDAQNGDTKDLQRTTIASLLAHVDVDTANSDAASMPPIVVDAGALDLLPHHVSPSIVLTPHAGELARLLTQIDTATTADEVRSQPLHYALLAHKLTGATVVLKGAITLIVGSDASGDPQVVVCGRAPSFLATAGAGDVLGGIIGAFLAQQAQHIVQHPEDIVRIVAGAVYVHGLAAAIAADSDHRAWTTPRIYGKHGATPHDLAWGHPIVASDVVRALPAAFDWLNTTKTRN